METKSTFKVSTKKDKEAIAVTTALEIDWAGCDEEMLRRFAAQALIVKLQSQWRRAETGIPSAAKVKAVEHAPGSRKTGGSSLEKLLAAAKDNPELRKQLLQALEAQELQSDE